MPTIDEFVTKFVFNEVGIDNVERKVNRSQQRIVNIAKKIGATLGAAIGGVALKRAFNNLTDELDRVAKSAARAGVSGENFQKLQFAASQSGLAIENLNTGLRFFNNTLGDAINKNDVAIKLFDKLGINIKDVEGNLKPTIPLLTEVADRLAAAGTQAERVNIAQDLFGGRSGEQFLTLLQNGGDEFLKLITRAEKLGIVFGEDVLANSEKLNDSMEQLGLVMRALRGKFLLAIVPSLLSMTDAMLDWWIANRKVISQRIDKTLEVIGRAFKALKRVLFLFTETIKGAVNLLGGFNSSLIFAGIGVVAFGRKWEKFDKLFRRTIIGAIITAIVLGLEDLYVFLQGGDSVIGAFLTWFETNFPNAFAVAEKAVNILSNIVEGVFGFIGNFVAQIIAIMTSDIEGFKQSGEAAINSLLGIFGLNLDKIGTKFKSKFNELKSFFTRFIDDIKKRWENGVKLINDLINKIPSFGGIVSGIKKLGSGDVQTRRDSLGVGDRSRAVPNNLTQSTNNDTNVKVEVSANGNDELGQSVSDGVYSGLRRAGLSGLDNTSNLYLSP